MRIMVFDIPAENGGALTILKQYYEIAKKDTLNEWYFVISTPILAADGHITILNYPWIKKSWLHRLYFDYFKAKKIVNNHQIDKVLSLQNVTIPKIKINQTLYLHQPLPFVEKRYKITEHFKYWVYQNVISKLIFKSIKEADTLIVQTKWLQQLCVQKLNIDPSKIIVRPPEVKINVKNYYNSELSNKRMFFYPASAAEYKNHRIIFEAVKKMSDIGINDFKIVFTLTGCENKEIKMMFDEVKKNDLPIDFIGIISCDEVYNYYQKSTLIFPSYIETFGLPMLEAKLHNTPILASDCPFSHEILDDYEKVTFFDPYSSDDLFKLMKGN